MWSRSALERKPRSWGGGWILVEPVGGKWESWSWRGVAVREDGDELEEGKDRFSESGNWERAVGEGGSPGRPLALGGDQREKAVLAT